ncbi:Eco57I restriction-modification methylase domain-containing protein [Salisaeta longa]|uniref:Eco57I restriction-modification methylase domain-containing protein n=1 Tax=Salisaeta longa TaxID=503170 RepID=UPI0012FAB052|nr:TaqI-like C-terminal specificity domain-containing protein [Salisaeta longa]
MPTPILFDKAVDNRSLFSDHYLAERFPERDDVQALHDDADAAYADVCALYAKHAAHTRNWNESQTEDQFIRPVLDILGWAREVQPHAQRQGRRGRPDYALFRSAERKETARQQSNDDATDLFRYADAVADAKYWGRPLDGPAPAPGRDGRAKMRQENPSFQIIDYVTLTGVAWGVLTNGSHWRLYYEKAPSRLETYLEINLEHICRLAQGTAEEQSEARHAFRLFYALFRAAAHTPTPQGPTFLEDVYAASDRYAEELEAELKDRIFDQVFLELATGLYENHRREHNPDDPEADLEAVYRATLRLLYRLLFLLYAESRTLLPLDNPGYQKHSLTRLATRAQRALAGGSPLSDRHSDFWNDLQALVRTIDKGDPTFDVPAYNGGLFDTTNPANAFLDDHTIGQRYIVRALVNLTAVDPHTNPTGPQVDYKALDVRQLGSIYEGLLEHRLVRTDDGALDLQTDKGERKKTGSYYTPHYIVEYIVEHTLGPIVERRIEQFAAAMARIAEIMDGRAPTDRGVRAKLDTPRRKALNALLTVRVCDPAMGSGHFLVHAADYLAEQFAQILSRYPENNPVTEYLAEIRERILQSLQRQGISPEAISASTRLRDTSLLKRLVMKRCIYGVDLNPMAVELAKVSLWLHSFTVGAPLSFLDHHLKAGNSLIGADVEAVMDAIQSDLFGNIRGEILRGTQFLQDAAFNTDATLTDVEESATAFRAYQDKMAPYKRLLDLWTAQHFDAPKGRTLVRDYAREVIEAYRTDGGAVLEEFPDTVATAERVAQEKRVFHWQLEFPEVYYDLDSSKRRSNPGFDAVIGNPPYVRMEAFKDMKHFLRSKYDVYAERMDLYGYFVEQAVGLLAHGQRLGFIVSNKWMRANYGTPIQELIKEYATVQQAIDFGDLPVFQATVYPLILILSKGTDPDAQGCSAQIPHLAFDSLNTIVNQVGVSFSQAQLHEIGWALLGNPGLDVVAKMKTQAVPLREYVGGSPLRGIVSGLNDAFIISRETRDRLIDRDEKSEEVLYPVRTGRDVRRYALRDPGTYLIYTKHGVDIDRYPAIKAHLQAFRSDLEGRATDQEWYELQQPQAAYEEAFKQPKIINPDLAEKGRFHLDRKGIFPTNKIYSLPTDDAYLLAILNSQLADFYLKATSVQYRGDYLQLLGQFVEQVPIRDIAFTTPADERTAHAEAAIAAYEAARDADAGPTVYAVLEAVDAHLTADPERADVVHDLLAHLAREMTRLKAERSTYHLDLTDYVPEPTAATGRPLVDFGRYQPVPGVQQSMLAATAATYDGLRIGTLSATRTDAAVTLRATARYKPAADDDLPDDALDRWGYHETDPVDVCTLHGCTDLEAALVVHWIDVLNAHGSGYGGYRDNATKTISLLDRLHAARFPDPTDDAIARQLRPFLNNAAEAARLDRHLAFTDALIDRIVYRLYGLTDEEVAVVEGRG